MKIGVPRETAEQRRRVALVPDVVKQPSPRGWTSSWRRVPAPRPSYTDDAYAEAGAEIGDPWGEVVLKVAPPTGDGSRG